MSTWAEIVDDVRARAEQRCEYCRMHQSLQGATFHVEHVIPSSCGGPTALENLALACPSCNLHKSNRVNAFDPQSDQSAPLFHPRRDAWHHHFRWIAYFIVSDSPTGRATIDALQLNFVRRHHIRQAEELFGLFPP